MNKKECLKHVVSGFLTELDKLGKVESSVLNRNHDGSFFLSNNDVTRIRGRKLSINCLFNPVQEEIFKATPNAQGGIDYLPFTNLNDALRMMNEHIERLPDDKCAEILSTLYQEINDVMSKVPDNEKISENEYTVRTGDKSGNRAALQVHSFQDKWLFNFLAKLVQTIREALGKKTTSEKLLDDSVEVMNESGIRPPGN